MSNHTTSTFIELPVCVECDYTPGCDAVMTLPNGDPGYPAEAPELEITAVYLERKTKDGTTERLDIIGWLSDSEIGELEDDCYEDMEQNDEY